MTHPLPAELQGVSVKELVKALGKRELEVPWQTKPVSIFLGPFCHVGRDCESVIRKNKFNIVNLDCITKTSMHKFYF